jgi:cytochrome c oxidase subunit IV
MNRLDRPSLVWGAVFCTVGLAYLLQELGVWDVRLGVIVPLLLIVAGLALALSAALPRTAARR